MKTAALILAACAVISSCSALPSRRMEKSRQAERADGFVRFKRVGIGETLIDLRLKRLAEPETIVPPGYAYVAWVKGSVDAPAQNVGALYLSPRDQDDGKPLDGRLKVVTPLRRFELFVTAEAASDVERPAGARLLWASLD